LAIFIHGDNRLFKEAKELREELDELRNEVAGNVRE
jgi:hypothetical protein